MFGFGVGEMAAVTGVITTLKSLNDSLATVKQAGANASQLTGLVTKYASLDKEIRDLERDKSGVLSVEAATQLRLAKRTQMNFETNLKDSLLMAGLGSEWRAIMDSVQQSRESHEREIARLKIKKRQRQKLMKEVGLYVTIGSICIIFALGGLWIWVEVFR